MRTWNDDIVFYRERYGRDGVDAAVKRAKESTRHLEPWERRWLEDHGYCPWAPPRGITGDTRLMCDRYPLIAFMRNRVCYIDGHEGSDLDPGVICMHCGLYTGEKPCECGSPWCDWCTDELQGQQVRHVNLQGRVTWYSAVLTPQLVEIAFMGGTITVYDYVQGQP